MRQNLLKYYTTKNTDILQMRWILSISGPYSIYTKNVYRIKKKIEKKASYRNRTDDHRITNAML